jgi:hypothetical protein
MLVQSRIDSDEEQKVMWADDETEFCSHTSIVGHEVAGFPVSQGYECLRG